MLEGPHAGRAPSLAEYCLEILSNFGKSTLCFHSALSPHVMELVLVSQQLFSRSPGLLRGPPVRGVAPYERGGALALASGVLKPLFLTSRYRKFPGTC